MSDGVTRLCSPAVTTSAWPSYDASCSIEGSDVYRSRQSSSDDAHLSRAWTATSAASGAATSDERPDDCEERVDWREPPPLPKSDFSEAAGGSLRRGGTVEPSGPSVDDRDPGSDPPPGAKPLLTADAETSLSSGGGVGARIDAAPALEATAAADASRSQCESEQRRGSDDEHDTSDAACRSSRMILARAWRVFEASTRRQSAADALSAVAATGSRRRQRKPVAIAPALITVNISDARSMHSS